MSVLIGVIFLKLLQQDSGFTSAASLQKDISKMPERMLILAGYQSIYGDGSRERISSLLNKPEDAKYMKLLKDNQYEVTKLKSGLTVVYPTFEEFYVHRFALLKDVLVLAKELSIGKTYLEKEVTHRVRSYVEALTSKDISDANVRFERQYTLEVTNGETVDGTYALTESVGSKSDRVALRNLGDKERPKLPPSSPDFMYLGSAFSEAANLKGKKVEKTKEALDWFKEYIDKKNESLSSLKAQLRDMEFPDAKLRRIVRAERGMVSELPESVQVRVKFKDLSKGLATPRDVSKFGYRVIKGTSTLMFGPVGVGISDF